MPDDGSNTSIEARSDVPFDPPMTATLPSSSLVAVVFMRAMLSAGPGLTRPVAGSKMSEEASTFGVPAVAGGTGVPDVPSQPPTISTRPSGRTVAACDSRAAERVDPASVKLLDVGSKSSRLLRAAPFADPPARSTWPL